MANLRGSFKYRKLLSAWTASLVFIIIFHHLMVADIRCDSVGSTGDILSLLSFDSAQKEQEKKELNLDNKTEQSSEKEPGSAGKTEDPLGFLREIYLDQNSKIITILSPLDSPVQKFHPNGRYGRRSIGGATSGGHSELGKLRFVDSNDDDNNNNNNGEPLKSLLYNLINNKSSQLPSQNEIDGLGPFVRGTKKHQVRRQADGGRFKRNNRWPIFEPSMTNLEAELSKILKCNYSGVPYLYWCSNVSS